MKFRDLGLDPKILSAVEDAGYETPTPIQAQAIPEALNGRDVLGIAQTGTGKTASFTLPMLTLLGKGRARARMPRSLILAPTRELAAQVSENFETYGKNTRLTKALLIGGVSFAEQDKIIDRGVDVLIATPGRLLDHFERGKLMLTGIEIMVVDEADRMLDMGFIEDIERIFKLTPFTRQTLFFSATMPPEITRLTQEFLSNPVRVEVARAATTAETVEQRLCEIRPSRKDRTEREKREALRALIDGEGASLTNGIIFCNRKRDVAVLFKSLTKHGYNAGALHGDLDQRVRMQVLDGFRSNAIKLLVASDVAARGLDIPSVSHVFNFDVPIHAEDYVHRIGRTGRAGRAGVAITLASPADAKHVAKVEELITKAIPRIDAPAITGDDAESSGDDSGWAPEEAGRRSRGRRRRGEDARDEDGADGREASARSDARRGDGRGEGRGEGRADDRRRDDRPKDARRGDDRRDDDRRGRRGSDDRRRGGRGGRDAEPRVVGLGDHVPAFLLREVVLPSRRKSAEDADGEDGAPLNTGSSEVEEAIEDAAADTSSDDASSAAVTESADAAAEQAEADAQTVAVESPEDAPKADVEGDTEAPKRKRAPRRTRRKAKAADEEAPAAQDEAEGAPTEMA